MLLGRYFYRLWCFLIALLMVGYALIFEFLAIKTLLSEKQRNFPA